MRSGQARTASAAARALWEFPNDQRSPKFYDKRVIRKFAELKRLLDERQAAFGAGPFALGYALPYALGLRASLPMELSVIPLSLVPLAFASAIIRYRLMDVEVIVKRSIVYAAVVLSIFTIYATGPSTATTTAPTYRVGNRLLNDVVTDQLTDGGHLRSLHRWVVAVPGQRVRQVARVAFPP